MRRFRAILATFALLALSGAHGATVTFTFGNGFDDATPVAPAGNNPGTTLGEQRRIMFQAAGDVWADIIVSSIPITVQADFIDLGCDGNTAMLATARPSGVFTNPALMGGTVFYPPALENALVGRNLDPGVPNIIIEANSLIDAPPPGCNATGFYYGLDNNPPPGKVSLFGTVLHELAHGLGMVSALNFDDNNNLDGSFRNNNTPSIYDVFIFDLDDNLKWTDMSNAQRLASSTDDPNVVWQGTNVTAQYPNFVTQGSNGGNMRLDAPAGFVGGSSISHFTESAAPNLLMEPFLRDDLQVGQTDLTPFLLQDLGYQINVSAPQEFTLSVTRNGSGRITSQPVGIDCGNTCSAGFTAGTAVMLAAMPDAGSTFAGWSGDCSGTGQVIMSANRSCTATFVQGTRTLSLNFAGDGSGSVTSIPDGIDCSADCAAEFATGTVVILTDAVAPGSSFTGWTGDCDGAGQVTLSADRSCTATFALEQQGMPTLTVEIGPGGSGSVISSPAGIDCGTDCSEAFPSGTQVMLTATPDTGFEFVGFTGPTDCQDGEVTLTADVTCQANFEIPFEPRIRLAPTVIDFTENATQTLTVFNDGGVDLAIFGFGVGCSNETACETPWLTVDVPSLSVSLGSSIEVALTVDFDLFATSHVPGTTYSFGFVTNDPVNPVVGVQLILIDDVIFANDFEVIEAGPPVRLRFVEFPSALEVGEAFRFQAQAFDADDIPVDAALTWGSGDDAIATVDNTGLVTGRGVGDVNIGVMLADDSEVFIQTFLTVTESEQPAELLAHWRFEGDAQDSSGFGHHGVLNGSASFSPGQFGQALDLRNGDGWIDVASSVLNGSESCSMSSWVRVETLVPDPDNGCCNAIFAEDQFLTGALHNNIKFAEPDVVEWVISGSLAATAPAPTIGSWVHYAWTYDSVSSLQKTYLRGVLVTEQEVAGPSCGSQMPGTIGAWDQRGNGEVIRFFDGQLDELRLYDGILSGADVLNIQDVNREYP